jgi:ABC-type branched-subunit amino acid transport system substrate-binding protein
MFSGFFPMITSISTNSKVTRIGDYIFRVCFNDRLQGDAMGRFALEELNVRTVVTVFNMASDYSMGLSRTFESAFSNAGGVLLARQFVARYADGGEIRAPTALAYDAVNLLADAVSRAGILQRVKIRNALAETRNFKGVRGTIAFDGFGDPVKSVVMMKIQNGRRIYLKQVKPGQKGKTPILRSLN